MHSVTNPFQACNDIFYRPNGVFRALTTTNNWSWLPFVLVIVASVLPGYLYFSSVDFSYYVDLLASTMGDVSPAEIEQFRQNQQQSFYVIIGLVGPLIGLPLYYLLIALYLHLATKSDEQNVQGFTDWYGFTWWISMPLLLSSLVSVLLIAISSDPQMSPAIMQPLSLAYLLGVPLSSDWNGLAGATSLIMLWTIYLTTVGISQWTSFSTKKSAVIAAAPYVLIYGVWALIVLLT
ncbi:YIP1 family protein [Salinimonas marina]|uniref:YIP1 family protein n=1 Tax=Salinimonas marina TaxID=2785918 RepID=A0A7S9HC19_9ALTE|nr:YIP1 family protein [Salinimonas marina]QPG04821.1 YIP1 family protein [Salinimonas marina]